MTTTPAPGNPLDDTGLRSTDQDPPPGRARRRRHVVTAAALLVMIALLGGNTAMVSSQDAGATGDSILHLDGGDLHVAQDGPRDAPALVLIHGLGASTAWWDGVIPMLATSYRVVRIDLLGHGRSAKPPGDGYLVPRQAGLVAQAIDRLGVRNAVVVGHSTGGYVATALAEQRADLVTALALIDTGPRTDAFVSDGPVGKLVFVPVLGHLLWRLRTDGLLRRSLGTAFAPGFPVPRQFVDDTRGMTFHALTTTSRGADEYLARRPVPDRLLGLGKPLLVIFGGRDQRWRPSSAELYRSVPGARVDVLPGAGHSPMVEDPERTAALLLGFARSATASR